MLAVFSALRDTASMTTEDLAGRKHLNIDLTQPDFFWQAGIDMVDWKISKRSWN